MDTVYDITGMRFGMVRVVRITNERKSHKRQWLCECDCGNEFTTDSYKLRHGDTVSCGCKRKTHNILAHAARRSHGMSGTRLYHIWRGIINRATDGICENHNVSYKKLGITVCDEWRKDFVSFYDWSISNGYADNLSIDRIDPYGNYEPNNCRWATIKQQANNRTDNFKYTSNGETHTLAEWQEITGIPRHRIKQRILHGWPDSAVFDKENHQSNPIMRRAKR